MRFALLSFHLRKVTVMHIQISVNEQSFASPSSARRSLGRTVFDNLFERDLLGILLSSKHFKTYITKVNFADSTALDINAVETDLLEDILSTDERTNSFHKFMLEMFAGVYIKECRHQDKSALMLDLDKKLAEEMMTSEELFDEMDESINHVELAWRYRRNCMNSDTRTF